MKRLALLILAATEALALTVVAVVCAALARDEDTHPLDCVGPCCDEGPDDLTALADAVGVLVPAEKWDAALARFERQVEFETRDLIAAVSVPEDFA